MVVNVSLALALVRSFFWLETSPHCETVPREGGADSSVSHMAS